ncbi:hypothetical protein OG542_37015 [Streptomyces violaceus]|uniref:hypothetical protein n=1 Tax=Streptomyces violaceus TaxID=1936 RepID=UPI002E1E56BB
MTEKATPMPQIPPVNEYTGMATLNHAFYVVDMGEPEGIALPSMTSGTRITATDSNSCLTITAGSSEWEPVKISFLVYDEEPAPLPGQWRHTETFTCTATDTPASFTTGTDPDDMFQDPPPDDLFNRPDFEPPYHWKGRLLIAAHKVEEHILQFWPA